MTDAPSERDAHPAASPGETQGPSTAATAAAHESKARKKKKKKQDEGKLGSSRGIETMFRTSYRTHLDLSSIADNKANIMISINGIIISIGIASVAPRIDSGPVLLLPTLTLLVGCVISMVFSVLAARPRVTSLPITLEDVRANRSNLLFFGNFVRLKEDDYVIGMKELLSDSDRLYVNMMRDLYGLGRVLDRKYRLLRSAYTVFMFALLLSVSVFLIAYLVDWRTSGLSTFP